MLLARQAAGTALAALLATTLTIAQVNAASPTPPTGRTPQAAASCYRQPHARSHEAHALSAALSEARHSLWLITQPRCGLTPLMQSVRRWSRLLFDPPR